jgi:drug/metabolite transporter superfamily protein YnfA
MAAFAPLGFIIFAALAALAAVRRESRAFGGGVLVTFGLWWAYFVRDAVERCELMNREPGGSCAIYGTTEQLALAGSIAVVGALLVTLSLREDRVKA